MWKHAASSLSKTICDSISLTNNVCFKNQIRTTFILKRKTEAPLHKKGHSPKKMRPRHYIYDVVKNTNVEKQPDIEIILTSFVDELGNIGDKISVRPNYAYNKLLLPGLAVYATPENIEKYKDGATGANQVHYSSATAARIMKYLSTFVLSVIMNKDHSWTLQPWHVKSAFRKGGFIVPEEAIKLPDKPISGPDLSIENKEFYVTVTINKMEKVNVRCRIHHWSTNVLDRIPPLEKYWEGQNEPIYPEFQETLNIIYSQNSGRDDKK